MLVLEFVDHSRFIRAKKWSLYERYELEIWIYLTKGVIVDHRQPAHALHWSLKNKELPAAVQEM